MKNAEYIPLCIGHRGASAIAPENTEAAFTHAINAEADGLELDIQLTKDQIPVIFHDKTLKRIIGIQKRISDYSYSELREMDFGSWFSDEFAGAGLLSLQRFLQDFGTATKLFVEIKSREHDRADGISEMLTRTTLAVLNNAIPEEHIDNIFIMSFDPEVIDLAYKINPKWKYVQLCHEGEPFELNHKKTKLHAYGLPVKNITPEMAKAVRRRKKKMLAYTCNTSAQLNALLEAKVEYIVSDKPDWLREKLNS